MIVVDASVLSSCRRDIIDLVIKEVCNTILEACILKKIMGLNEALKLYKILESMIGVNIILEPEEKYLRKALDIALEQKITIYDALYIALAKEKDLPLLTLDEKQKETAERLGVKTVHIERKEK